MKASVTSISFALLCSLLSLENASAFMGFSFGNLLFSLHMCHHINHGPLGCKLDCNSHFPPGPPRVCDSSCYTQSEAICASKRDIDMSNYFQCMATETEICNSSTDSSTSYSDASDSTSSYSNATGADVSSYVGDTTSSNGTPPVAVRGVSLLPFFIAATVSTMALMFYAWRKKSKEQQLHKEELLGSDADTFHGSVARRIERAQTMTSPPPAEVSYPDYAMA